MDNVINALKLPFVTLPPEQKPSDRTVVLVWAAVGLIIGRSL